MMRGIGSMNRRLTLETPALTPDGLGGGTPLWEALGTLWAHVDPRSGTEAADNGRIAGTVSHHITIRHRGGVTPAMRFRFGTRAFHILAVLEDGLRRRLICHCEERDI